MTKLHILGVHNPYLGIIIAYGRTKRSGINPD